MIERDAALRRAQKVLTDGWIIGRWGDDGARGARWSMIRATLEPLIADALQEAVRGCPACYYGSGVHMPDCPTMKPLHIEGPVEGLDGSDPGAGSINRRPKK